MQADIKAESRLNTTLQNTLISLVVQTNNCIRACRCSSGFLKRQFDSMRDHGSYLLGMLEFEQKQVVG